MRAELLRARRSIDWISLPSNEGSGRCVWISASLVTNALFCTVFDHLLLDNEIDTTYRWLNTVNPNLPIRPTEGGFVIDDGFENHPVVGVNWNGATLFCHLLGARLPTSAEWTLMATSGVEGRLYPWGDLLPSTSRANFDNNVGSTTPVGSYPPTDLGFYDVAGNVREWCSDPFENTAQKEWRVIRGGSWNKPGSYLGCDVVRGKWRRQGSDSCGFRLVVESLT